MASKKKAQTTVVYNCKVNRENKYVVAAVRNLTRIHEPEVVSLQEALKYLPDLRLHFGNDYDFVVDPTADFGNRRASTALMVRKPSGLRKSQIVKTAHIRCHKTWVGPQGGTLPGRSYPVAWLRDKTVHIGIHSVWGPTRPQNVEASKEEHARLVEYVNNIPRKYTVILSGDFNTFEDNQHYRAVSGFANQIGGNLIVGGGVDHAIIRTGSGSCWQGPTYGSDHKSKIFTLVKDSK